MFKIQGWVASQIRDKINLLIACCSILSLAPDNSQLSSNLNMMQFLKFSHPMVQANFPRNSKPKTLLDMKQMLNWFSGKRSSTKFYRTCINFTSIFPMQLIQNLMYCSFEASKWNKWNEHCHCNTKNPKKKILQFYDFVYERLFCCWYSTALIKYLTDFNI